MGLEEDIIASHSKQLLKGLRYLHSLTPCLIHRDLKCANCLLSHSGKVKIADFGCAKLLKGDMNQPHTLAGTVQWMSPEQIMSEASITARSDIWSFGCCAIELATAANPWKELRYDNPWAYAAHIANKGGIPDVPTSMSPEALAFMR